MIEGRICLEGLELDEDNHSVLWKTEAEKAQKNILAWRMLENNEISGFLSFDYYYIDNQICFRYAYHSLQRVEEFFQKKMGDFETLSFLSGELLYILESGQEYLLDDGGYLLSPEWIFWNRLEKKVYLCYLPGKGGDIGEEYMAIVEFLMQHTNHADKKAVKLIYGLYDLLVSDGFVPENLLLFIQKIKKEEGENLDTLNREILQNTNCIFSNIEEKTYSKRDKECEKKGKENIEKEKLKTIGNTWKAYSLKFHRIAKTGKLWGEMYTKDKGNVFFVQQERLVVGREKGSDLYIPFDTVSRHHAMLFCEQDGLYLMDTRSTNGTFLNGNKISAYVKTPCKEKDIITFADISYQLIREDS